MDYHLDSREHDSDYFTPPSPDKHNKMTESRIINMQSYQVLETPSSSRSNASPSSTSSSPVMCKANSKQIVNKAPPSHIQNQAGKGQSVATSESDRPPHSYIALISMAILSKIDRKILLNEIYDWVIQNFPYYQSRTDKSWRNSIRHNLSLNECFIKVGKAGNGRGYYWSIHSANLNDFKKGDFRRRQARLRAKHDKNHASPSSKSSCKETKEKVLTNPNQNQNGQNFQNNFYPVASSSSYCNSDFNNFYSQNTYQTCVYPNTASYDNNEYFYPYNNNDQNINESNYLSPNISSSSVSSKESSASSTGILSTTPLNQTPLTPLTPITTNNNKSSSSSSSSSTSSSLSSSPLSSTNISSSSCLYNQNYNHFNSNAWFHQQPALDQFQANNAYSYPTGSNSTNLYQNQTYYGYNTQGSLNQSNNSILMPLNANESNEAQQSNMDNLIYCTTSNQTNDYAQYATRPTFSFL